MEMPYLDGVNNHGYPNTILPETKFGQLNLVWEHLEYKVIERFDPIGLGIHIPTRQSPSWRIALHRRMTRMFRGVGRPKSDIGCWWGVNRQMVRIYRRGVKRTERRLRR